LPHDPRYISNKQPSSNIAIVISSSRRFGCAESAPACACPSSIIAKSWPGASFGRRGIETADGACSRSKSRPVSRPLPGLPRRPENVSGPRRHRYRPRKNHARPTDQSAGDSLGHRPARCGATGCPRMGCTLPLGFCMSLIHERHSGAAPAHNRSSQLGKPEPADRRMSSVIRFSLVEGNGPWVSDASAASLPIPHRRQLGVMWLRSSARKGRGVGTCSTKSCRSSRDYRRDRQPRRGGHRLSLLYMWCQKSGVPTSGRHPADRGANPIAAVLRMGSPLTDPESTLTTDAVVRQRLKGRDGKRRLPRAGAIRTHHVSACIETLTRWANGYVKVLSANSPRPVGWLRGVRRGTLPIMVGGNARGGSWICN
jgi:hypothetical protein